MTKISPVLYTDKDTKPSYFLSLAEDHKGPVLRIVDQDGNQAYCGNLLGLTSEGVSIRSSVSISVAEAAGLPASMFEGGRLKVCGFIPKDDIEKCRTPVSSPSRIVSERYGCAVARGDSLVVEEAERSGGLVFGATEEEHSVYIRLAVSDVKALHKRLGEHLAAVS